MTATLSNIQLRAYQDENLEEIRDLIRQGFKRILLVQPTGAGKGTLASFIVHSAAAKGRRIQFWVNRRTLVHDMSQRLTKLSVDHGVIMASSKLRKPWCPVQVCSIDTLRNREVPPQADLIFLDEAHFCVSAGWLEMIAKYPKATFILMTATPIRLDNRGLGEIADVMVPGPSVQDLVNQGYLVPSRVFSFQQADLNGVKKQNGDFNQKQLAEACDKNVLVGDIVKNWLYRAADRKSVFFGVDKKHAAHVAEQFRAVGVSAVDVNDETPDDERDRIWHDLDHGDLRMVTSVGVISYGWDHPIVSCCVLGRPTEALALHLQQIGRGARPYPGKRDLLIHDHAGNHHRHGFYEDAREWSLKGGLVKRPGDKVTSVCTCPACFMTFASGPDRCPACGSPIPKQHRVMRVVDAELQEIQRKAAAIDSWRENCSSDQKLQKFLEYRRQARDRGYSRKYPFARFMGTFKEPPKGDWWRLPI